ncbi:hypothetical protein AHAS_Ahas20G0212000 [Arachis hypogaea]
MMTKQTKLDSSSRCVTLTKRLLTWLCLPRECSVQTKRYFIRSAQLLAKARITKKNQSSSFNSLANEALAEADQQSCSIQGL